MFKVQNGLFCCRSGYDDDDERPFKKEGRTDHAPRHKQAQENASPTTASTPPPPLFRIADGGEEQTGRGFLF